MRCRHVTPLKLAIVASGRDQQDIATEIGVHPSHLSRIVNGLHVDQSTCESIALALGKPIDELFPSVERAA